jgi:hypothetical protein
MTGTELHVPRGAAGRGPNRDCGPYAGHVGAARRCLYGTTGRAEAAEATRRRMHISVPPAAGPARGPWAASGPEELRDSERTYVSTHAHLGTAGRKTRKGTAGCERAGGAA